jgi:N-dimethylarginine dimethylaminohydrolase
VETLYSTYVDSGFDVHLIDPIDGLPGGLTAANGGFVLENIARWRVQEFQAPAARGPGAYMDWFRENGSDTKAPDKHQRGRG